MSGPAGIPRWDEVQGKDDRLANRIISLLHSVRRISAGALDALNTQLSLARYPTAEYKIKKLPITALEPMHSLVVGFLAQLQAATSPVLNTAFRDQGFDVAGDAFVAATAFPLTLLSPLDNSPQVCVVFEDTNGPNNLDFGTYLNSNKTGKLSSDAQIFAAAGWPTTTIPQITKISDLMAVIRHPDLNTNDDLFSLTLSAAGVATVTKLTDLVETATFTSRAPLQDFSDGKYLWLFEAKAGSITIQKIKLSDFSVTKQTITSITITKEAFFHAYGDTWLLIGQDAAGATPTRYLTGTLVDGAADVPVALTTGTLFQQNSVNLRGMIGAPIGAGEKVRVFATAGLTAGNGVVSALFDFSSGTVTMAKEVIFGMALNWGVDLLAQKLAGFSTDNGRLVQAVTPATASVDFYVYSMVAGRQIVAINPAQAMITEVSSVSWVNCTGAPLLAMASLAAGPHILEISS